ncbi:hypothetical protein SAMN06265361_10440 [Laceyella tengchongensis]|uniref:TraC-like domain-containing protein n=1 Tax=Laceyella tengchongensis TaxID=574699 RepID=A0AA45WPQ2_9BACL|nr:hypothetical protein [Laceyella tengchongensis]SMP22316.1 hypothetical protein SAMN06265361_10440 [Laceyella tengchongensis]
MAKKQTAEKKTVQDLIPVRNIYDSVIETTDNRFVKVLSVTAINTHLMSYQEVKEVLEGYENFLRSLKKPIQIARVSEPINLKKYIMALNNRFQSTTNAHKRRMLESYISYAEHLQKDRDMIKRNRYVIVDEPFNNETGKEKAMIELRRRVDDLRLNLEDMFYRQKLEVKELNDNELRKYLHMFYDYENAQLYQMEDMKEYAYVIGKRNLVTAAEEIRKRDEY